MALEQNSEHWCRCLSRRTLRQAFGDLTDEAAELLRVRATEDLLDEASDVAFAVGRLLGAATGRSYIHVPGDGRHVAKIAERMDQHGCVRSVRHLVDGRCPSAEGSSSSGGLGGDVGNVTESS
jgi:hypothetical protein